MEWKGEITLGDGSVVKGATLEEAFENLSKMKVDTATALRTEREEKAKLAGQVQTYEQTINSLSNKPETKTVRNGEFDRDEYYRLLNADPMAANDYYFQHRFGQNPDQFNEQYQKQQQYIEYLQGQTVALSFSAQHAEDFPSSPESAAAMRQRVEQLTNSGFPFNLETMNYAYGQLIEEGKIKPVEKTEEEKPNPSLKGSQVEQEVDIKKYESMSMADLEKEMRKQGMFR